MYEGRGEPLRDRVCVDVDLVRVGVRVRVGVGVRVGVRSRGREPLLGSGSEFARVSKVGVRARVER